ncbi:MAG: FecR domain-containing protein [Candidatus Eremiobacteraeota bacterium]|nr:FecR domain-containing protein [Candidatus Eremiobacteraeota bacterium]MBC5803399.1 FecR domain-containing protein [Candidatus Eremiobacteraeota bacterium]MBC5822509.1 FecR domain-containing protein [Candidatus Eremiobacteraeota bacterium]
MSFPKRSIGALLVGAVALTGTFGYASPAVAQAYPGGNGPTGVANLSVADGNVVIIRGDSGVQSAGTVNAPLLPGDYIATGSNSLAEVQFDGISMLRLAPNTQVRFVNLNPATREMLLATGTVDLAELQGADGSPQIDTPSLTVRPNASGDYRVSTLSNGQTLVTVRSGSANVASGAGSQTLSPGSTLSAYGNYSNPSTGFQGPVAYDSFDGFNRSRDQALESAYNSNPYLSPQLAGYSNFANYGQWQNVPGYGYAWAPNNQNQTNFAPYQNGQWAFEPGYGYTWVANEPWGYAPSHYGTWFNNPSYGGWLWQPPASQYQSSSSALSSAWLPALVSFFLSGNNGGGLGGLSSLLGNLVNPSGNANIGWIPLAPGEQYQPWYNNNQPQYNYNQPTYTPSYPPTTVSNVTNITNYYVNAKYPGGATIVPISAWRKGNFRDHVNIAPQQLRAVALVRGAIPVVPTAATLRYSQHVAVKHPIVLARTFRTNPRFAAKARIVARPSFKAQQAQFKKIVSAKPKVVPLPARTAIVHPIYHPRLLAPVHLTTLTGSSVHAVRTAEPIRRSVHAGRPAARPTGATRRQVHAPARKPAVRNAPAAKHVEAPLAPRPAARRAAAPTPIVQPVAAPKPTQPAAAPKPVVHPAAAPKPVVQPVAVPRPVVHPVATPRPVVQPAAAPKPVVHPVAAPRPVVQPVAAPKPVVHPVTAPKPVVHPVGAPAATPHPAAHVPSPAHGFR